MLTPGEVRVWWAAPHAFTGEAIAARAVSLPEDERRRVAGFVHERDREQALLARLMVRQVLAITAGDVKPEDWRFVRTPFGRPVIANPGFDWLTFSLSHTQTLVVCAVAARADLGVDVEPTSRPAPLEVANRYFSEREVAHILAAPDGQRARRFFEYWTLKEAFMKAVELGFSLPLDQFSFDLGPAGIVIQLADELAKSVGPASRWQFRLESPPEGGHVLAVASTVGAPLQVTLHAAEPLLTGAGAARPR